MAQGHFDGWKYYYGSLKNDPSKPAGDGSASATPSGGTEKTMPTPTDQSPAPQTTPSNATPAPVPPANPVSQPSNPFADYLASIH